MLLHHNAKNVPQNHFFYLSDLFHSNLQEDSLFQAWSNLKDIPVGLAYATWSGTGILMVSTLGILFYGQHPDTAAIIGMVIIASGIVIMNLFSKMGSEEAEETPVTNLDKKIAN